MAHEAGKGSRPRPFSVTQEVFDQRWQQIFSSRVREERQEITTEECLKDIDDSEQVGP